MKKRSLIAGLSAVALASSYFFVPAFAASSLFGDAAIVAGGNPGNAVQIRSDVNVSPGYGGITFDDASGLTFPSLTTLSTDFNVTDDSCGGGSPRFQIQVDTDNDTVSNGNVFVYMGPSPSYTGCTSGWQNTGNLIGNSDAGRWDFTQFGGPLGTYASAPANVLAGKVLNISIVDDSSWNASATGGDSEMTTLLDNVVINSTTYTFPQTGSLTVYKYTCPTGTTTTRAGNAPDAAGVHAVPAGCGLEQGVEFGYIHQSDKTDYSSPLLGFPPDMTPYTSMGMTGVNGTVTTSGLDSTGRYDVAELSGTGAYVTPSNLISFYCAGTDPGTGANNYEIAFVPGSGTTYCVAYNAAESCTETTDVVAHWKLDEGTGTNAEDSTVNTHDGTLENSPTWSTTVAPLSSPNPYSLSFDGTNDQVRVPADNALKFGNSEFTVSLYTKTATGDRSVMGNFSGSLGWGLYFYGTNRVNFFGYGAGGTNDASQAATILDDNWHHIAGVYKRTGTSLTIDTYVDGVLKGTSTATVGDISSPSDVLLGKYTNQPNYQGLLDDVRIFNRALSASEVASIAGGTCPVQPVLNGTIIIDKVTNPSGDSQSFSFDASGGSYADFSLTDAAAPNNQSLVAGTYSVVETVPSGWTQTSATCSDGSPVTAIVLSAGETVTCTFTNTKQVVVAGPTCNSLPATVYVKNGKIVGGPNNGQTYAGELNGTSGNDVIVGTAQTDEIDGNGGNDTICGGDSKDIVDGDSGNDTIFGEAGNDELEGGGGLDTLNGGAGLDMLDGGGDNDMLIGGTENDTFDGGSGLDVMCGGSGNDNMDAASGDDKLDGGIGTDTLKGGLGTDKCSNGESNSSCESIVAIPECSGL